jgi:hypothetical protein
MFREALPCGPEVFRGRRIVRVYEVIDTDRDEFALLLDDHKLIQVSCDPSYDAAGVSRTPDKWEVVLYDATDTEAGHEFARPDNE